jgi:hypothetical protein
MGFRGGTEGGTMTQHDLDMEFKRWHPRLDEITPAPRALMVLVWSAVLVLCLTIWTGVILTVYSWLPMDWRVWP